MVNSPVTWDTPWRTEGGFSHRIPAGSHPVYAGSCSYAPPGEDADALRLTVTMLVMPLAEPSRIEAADWNVPGYHDVHLIEDYAVLWGEEAMRPSLPHADDEPSFVPRCAK